jgi:hypothetical protein
MKKKLTTKSAELNQTKGELTKATMSTEPTT